MNNFNITDWLPTSAKEVRALGWEQLDVILFSGDAYVDHPSFGAAVVGRLLQAEGYKVAIVPQPNWQDDLRDFKKLGVPRLFFGISGGAMDSMVNHYTANKRLRSDDAYTAGGGAGFRPDYVVTVYSQILKKLYPNIPVVIGGIEASLRRLAHYDYWSNTIMPSILIESGADVLLYGMGEKVLPELARTIHNGFNVNLIRNIRQVAFVADKDYVDQIEEGDKIELNSYDTSRSDKKAFADNFVKVEIESNRKKSDNIIVEQQDQHRYVVVNPPFAKLSEQELDRAFALPYTRLPHPRYNRRGDIPAYEMIKHSVNIHRGCFGGCSFCTISAHQGKFVSSRSEQSILDEVEKITQMSDFRGNLSDVGGPSANMYGMEGKDKSICEKCVRPSCIYPKVCANLDNNHGRLLELYRRVRAADGVKKAFVGSGVRYDMFDKKYGDEYLRELVVNHTSGRLKVAPEHTESDVLRFMRKPTFDLFEKLNSDFNRICKENNLRYQLIPYFISSHPGCTESDMRELSKKTRSLNFRLEQVQDLTPTPMTLSSVMFYTGINPYSGEELYVARSQDDKRKQKSYFFEKPSRPKNKNRGQKNPKGRNHRGRRR